MKRHRPIDKALYISATDKDAAVMRMSGESICVLRPEFIASCYIH